ncbi:MAG: hypothetical protein QM770_20360 [Tepidisphaeraceae bacterium]
MTTHRRPQLEYLEGRRLLTVFPALHTVLARRSVAETLADDNEYYNGTAAVTWAGLNGATKTTNKSDCTTYVTLQLKQAYGFSSSDFIGWTDAATTDASGDGVSSPNTKRYYNMAMANLAGSGSSLKTGFEGFKNISDLRIGDLFVSRYDYAGATSNGHMTQVDQLPTYAGIFTRTIGGVSQQVKAWNCVIIDCTSSLHSSDSRNNAQFDSTTGAYVDDDGIGRGAMRFWTDLNDNLVSWSWSTNSSSIIYEPLDRPCVFAKMPPAVSGSDFAAGAALAPTVSVSFTHELTTAGTTASDLKITNLTDGKTYAATSVQLVNSGNDGSVATFSLPKTLPDGNYRFQLTGSSVITPRSNWVYNDLDLQGSDIYLLGGDANRDHKVDFTDLLTLAANYGGNGKTLPSGDFNYDGAADFNDLLILARNYGKTLTGAADLATEPTSAQIIDAAPIAAAPEASGKQEGSGMAADILS